jgi:hypothetical protein
MGFLGSMAAADYTAEDRREMLPAAQIDAGYF